MAGPKWLDPEEMKAWRLYITTSVDLMKALEDDVRPFGLRLLRQDNTQFRPSVPLANNS